MVAFFAEFRVSELVASAKNDMLDQALWFSDVQLQREKMSIWNRGSKTDEKWKGRVFRHGFMPSGGHTGIFGALKFDRGLVVLSPGRAAFN